MVKPITLSYWTLVLLCFGYFIDFYDLTIFSASYAQVIPDLLAITDKQQIQQTYLTISNYYTIGILSGGLFFGYLADRIGRSQVIKLSIVVYSVATIATVFCHQLTLVIMLRFLAGFGLATEFATSSVLISELFSLLQVPQYMMYLYLSGILGGVCATYLAIFSWQWLFIFGGSAGFLLFFARQKLVESPLFLQYNQRRMKGSIGNKRFYHQLSFARFSKLLALIIPYNLLIALMFIFPSFMSLPFKLADAIHQLLFYFFIGNVISTVLASMWVKRQQRYNGFLLANFGLFVLVMLLFPWIHTQFSFVLYSLALGLLGGGLPTIWMQIVVRHYPTSLRSRAANLLFAAGRLTMIGFNLLIGYSLNYPHYFSTIALLLTVIVALFAIIALSYTQESYTMPVDY